MEMILIPGYKDLFGEPTLCYDELMKDLPTDISVRLAIALNAEVWNGEEDVQISIRQRLAARFSDDQIEAVVKAFTKYRMRTKGEYKMELFSRMFFLGMIHRELNRRAYFDLQDDSGQQEYNFLMAYLYIIDEFNSRSKQLLEHALQKAGEEDLKMFRILWEPLLPQFQYSEKPELPYEVFKLTCFLCYALDRWRVYLREYLHKLGCKSISHLLNSFVQLVMGSVEKRSDQFLPGLIYFKPKPGTDDSHLKAMAINQVEGRPITVADMKQYPLFYNSEKGYMIVDKGFYFKKVYRGPFFELLKGTSMKMDFNSYSSEVSKNVLEDIVFRGILSGMKSKVEENLIFDNGTDNCPDCYHQVDNEAMLFEFKAYLFPDTLPDQPDFEAIKEYIDKKFVTSEKGKAKGVGQLLDQIEQLTDGSAAFTKDTNRGLTLYPIICFDDFYFTMPGINEYLNLVFQNRLPERAKTNFNIKPITLINLDLLFKLSVKNVTFGELKGLIKNYWRILSDRKRLYFENPGKDTFLSFQSSFDEIVHTELRFILDKTMPENPLNKVLNFSNITQVNLDIIV